MNVQGTMSQGLLKRFEVLKKCTNKFDCLVYEMLFYKSFKAKSQRAITLHSCESIFIIFAPSYVNSSRQNVFLDNIFLDNGVMSTPKRRILSFVFTVLCFKKSLLIRSTHYPKIIKKWKVKKNSRFLSTGHRIFPSCEGAWNCGRLRWFLGIALRIPTAHDFRVISARTLARARTKRKRIPSN